MPRIKGHSGHALFADHAHLEGPAFVDRGQQRDETVEREVDIANYSTRFIENLPKPSASLARAH